MNQEKVLGLIRHLLTFVGGVLITKGVIDEAVYNELLGAITTLIGAIWSIVDKNTVRTVAENVKDKLEETTENVKSKFNK